MKFKINNRNWEIKELSQKEMREIQNAKEEENGYYYGLTKYTKQTIYICKELPIEQKRQTLLHELFHCYVGVYCSFQTESMDIELVCDTSANSHDIIHNIAEKYFNKKRG